MMMMMMMMMTTTMTTTTKKVTAYFSTTIAVSPVTMYRVTVLSCFSSKFTFIYTKLKLKTCRTRWLNFKNDIGKMTTVFLDAVFKPFFKNSP